jgi:hypothetical protein
MPLARIFTRYPDRTADLSHQLQQQGYTVEVASPDQAHLAPADLEIEFEVCERADVLERAAGLATELGADVAVAPGVLQPVAEQNTSMAEPVTENVVKLKAHDAAERDPEREFEAAFAPVIEMPATMHGTADVVDEPVMEHEPMPPVAFLDDQPTPEPSPTARTSEQYPAGFAEPARPADPMPYLSQLTPFGNPAARVEEQQQAGEYSNDRPIKEPPQIQVRGRKVLQNGAKIAAQSWAGVLALASAASASVSDYFQEYRKRAQVRSAQSRAEHAARLLDLEQRRAEAQQRATELEAAREAAAARLMELVRQRDPGLPQERPQQEQLRQERQREPISIEQSVPAQNLASQSVYRNTQETFGGRQGAPVTSSMREPSKRETGRKPVRPAATATPIELWRRINPPLRSVLAGAAAVTALFIVGIAMGVFHSKPPLANTADHPANGVTVKTGGVTVQAGAAKPQPSQPAAGQPQAKPQPGQPAGGAVQAQSGTNSTSKPSPQVQAAHLESQQSEKQIGDDVVIRHYSRPLPTEKPKQTGQQAGLKHFSDLDN